MRSEARVTVLAQTVEVRICVGITSYRLHLLGDSTCNLPTRSCHQRSPPPCYRPVLHRAGYRSPSHSRTRRRRPYLSGVEVCKRVVPISENSCKYVTGVVYQSVSLRIRATALSERSIVQSVGDLRSSGETAERYGRLELRLGRWRDDQGPIAPQLEFAVVLHPGSGIVDDDGWQVLFVVPRGLVSSSRQFLVRCVCDVFGGDAAEVR